MFMKTTIVIVKISMGKNLGGDEGKTPPPHFGKFGPHFVAYSFQRLHQQCAEFVYESVIADYFVYFLYICKSTNSSENGYGGYLVAY